MRLSRKGALAGLIAASMLGGGAVGAAAFGTAASSAASTTSTAPSASGAANPTPPAGQPPNGKFVPNENPAHEKSESAAREAQENAGQMPTVP